MSVMTAPSAAKVDVLTANDRLKQRFDDWFWWSVIAAVVIHALLFAYFPTLSAQDMSFTTPEIEALDLPPEVQIPPPRRPVFQGTTFGEDVTIAPTTFEDNPIENLPPPPTATPEDLSARPVPTPYTVAPELRNRAEVQRALVRFYPPLLRD